MAPDEIRLRVKAARALRGLSVAQLADRIDQAGLGRSTLEDLESRKAKRPFRPMEIQAIATACDLPYAFFTVDFARLSALDEDNDIAHRMAALEAAVRQLVAERSAPEPPGELGRRAEGSQPSAESQSPSEPQEGEDPSPSGEG